MYEKHRELNRSIVCACVADLATGGCMGNFRWDGGAKRKFLDESLPTDSAVLKIFYYYNFGTLSSILCYFIGSNALPRHLSR